MAPMRNLQRLCLGVAVAALVACGGGRQPAPAAGQRGAADEGSSNGEAGSTSEAGRTRAMAGQAAGMNQGFEDAKAAGATGADAEAAYQKFEQERAALDRTGQGEQPAEPAAPPEPADQGSDYQPPPPR